MRPRLEPLRVAGLTAAIAALGATVVLAATSKPAQFSDPKNDVSGVLDVQRVSLRLASDGRLRAVITIADKISPNTMLARTGPPGSVCLKVWTDAEPTRSGAPR